MYSETQWPVWVFLLAVWITIATVAVVYIEQIIISHIVG
jgi:hypothetical protein